MKRTSLYVTEEAAKKLEEAADQVVAAFGDDGLPRHVALSALLLAGAGEAEAVTQRLVQERVAELAERLAALQRGRGSAE